MNGIGSIPSAPELPDQPIPAETKGIWRGETIEKLMASDLGVIPSEVANLLKESHPQITPEIRFYAALFLAKQEGGYEDAHIQVWQSTATKVSLIFKESFVSIGAGKAGKVERGEVEVLQLKQTKSQKKTQLVRKISHSSEQFDKLMQGNTLVQLLIDKYGSGKGELEGLVKPFVSIDEKSRAAYGTSYVGHLADWEAATDPPPTPKEILEGFLSSLKGLDVLQKEGVVHIDLKIQNFLAKMGVKPHFVIADFDGVFDLPRAGDTRSHEELLAHFNQALNDVNGNPYTPEFTPQYTPQAEVEKLKSLFDALRERNPPPSRDEIIRLSEQAATIVKQIQTFQMGCLIAEMVTGGSVDMFWVGGKENSQFEFPSRDAILENIEMREGIPEGQITPLADLLAEMTRENPEERPSLQEVQQRLATIMQAM